MAAASAEGRSPTAWRSDTAVLAAPPAAGSGDGHEGAAVVGLARSGRRDGGEHDGVLDKVGLVAARKAASASGITAVLPRIGGAPPGK
jgi:hypothetical protein